MELLFDILLLIVKYNLSNRPTIVVSLSNFYESFILVF